MISNSDFYDDNYNDDYDDDYQGGTDFAKLQKMQCFFTRQ
jgi:hypothetical protein